MLELLLEPNFVLKLPDEFDFWNICLVDDEPDDEEDEVFEDDDEDEDELVVFLEAGPLFTPGLRPVCNFLLYNADADEDDDPEAEPPEPCVEPWLDFVEFDIFEDDVEDDDDDDLWDVLFMVNFKPSCDDLTIYSLLLLLLPPLVLRVSFAAIAVEEVDDNLLNSLLPGGCCISVAGCLCLSAGSSNWRCGDRVEAVETVAVVGVDVIKLTWQIW